MAGRRMGTGGGKGRRAPGGTPGVMPPQLRRSYLYGKASAKIGWGTAGDFKRCEAEAAHHGISARMRPGMCAKLHKARVGFWPGRGRKH